MFHRKLALSLAIFSSAQAATIHVPGEQPTIQAGLDAAAEGDTVLVAAGTYTGAGNKDIDFHGIDRVLLAESGAEATVIDCGGDGRGFYFTNGETRASIVSGFTITGGAVGHWPGRGGGIDCEYNSSPTLTHCTISGNWAASGGGVHCNNASPTLTHCTISDNSADGFYGHCGGGLSCFDSSFPTLTNCTISGNSTNSDGGGIYCLDSSPTLMNCTISDNDTFVEGWRGGGLSCVCSAPTLTNCLVSGNRANMGGGIHCTDSSPTLTNCTISNNWAAYAGGGVRCDEYSSPTLTNCVLWGDTPDEIFVDTGNPTLTYCDVEGGYEGEGNIDADPLFVDMASGDYHLAEGSPCIDEGTSAGAPDTDFEGDPRPWGMGYDIGADEYRLVGVVGSPPPAPPAMTVLAAAFPNPFNPHTTIPFELAAAGHVRLTIYDIRGSLIRVLLDDERRAGSHAVHWDGTDRAGGGVATGLYLVRLEAGQVRTTRKLMLVK